VVEGIAVSVAVGGTGVGCAALVFGAQADRTRVATIKMLTTFFLAMITPFTENCSVQNG
jgi:hypothetical protein